jgi:hypothetical protein
MNSPDSSGNFVARDAFVGLRGAFGSVALGRFAGAYKTTGGITWDGFQFTSLTPIGQGGMAGGNFGNAGFVSHLIEYRTPRWGTPEGARFDAVVQYSGDDAPDNVPSARGSALGGATLGWGGLELIVAAAGDKTTGAENYKAGARWQSGNLALALVHEDVESGGFDPGGAGRFLTGMAHWQAGNALWMLQAGRYTSDYVDLGAGIASSDARYAALGLRYYFARNVWGILGYRDTASDIDVRDSSAFVVGLRFDFQTP